jgi:hypothetical protein
MLPEYSTGATGMQYRGYQNTVPGLPECSTGATGGTGWFLVVILIEDFIVKKQK